MGLMELINLWIFRLSFGINERVQLYRMLAKTTDEKRKGLKLVQIISYLIKLDKKRSGRYTQLRMHRRWLAELKGGKPFGEILKKYVPPIEAMIIYSCETSGLMSNGFNLATEIAVMQQEFMGLLRSSIAAAVFNFLAGLALLSFFCKRIMPSLGGFIPLRSRTASTTFWLNVSAGYDKWFPVAILLIMGAILGIGLVMRFYVGPWRKFLDRFPPFSVYRLVVGCGFLYSVNSLSKAGVQHTKSLEIMEQFAAPYLKYRIQRILIYMNHGQSLGEAIMSMNLDFPDRNFVDQLELYASQSVLDEMFEQVVVDMRVEGAEFIAKQGAIIKYTGLILNSLLLTFLAMGFFGMVFNLYSSQ
jgi:type II secretory pathway component PulF